MDSVWQNPISLGEEATKRVVVYVYSDRWIPISYFSYSEAIRLSRKARLKGKKAFVFPTGLNLETKNILLTEPLEWQDKLNSELA